MRMCMLHFLKNISREPIGYNTKIDTGGVEWGRVDMWIVLLTSLRLDTLYAQLKIILFNLFVSWLL